MRTLIFGLSSVLLFTACGNSSEDDTEPMFELPQILVDRSPICLSYEPATVGNTQSYVALFTNNGEQQLVIDEAVIEEDSRGHFSIAGVDPMQVNFTESSHVQLSYKPIAEGWDYAYLRVKSNAQNYPNLRVFVLALAMPDNPPMGWDPGPKPEVATSGEEEACKDDFVPDM